MDMGSDRNSDIGRQNTQRNEVALIGLIVIGLHENKIIEARFFKLCFVISRVTGQ